MKKNLVPLVAVALAVAIVSTGIFYGLFVGKLKGGPTQTVITAARPLAAGTVLTDADLGRIEWSGETIPTGMYTNNAELVGKTVLQPVDAGEPVLASRVIAKNGGTLGVPEGMRAVSVHVSDSSGIISLLKPGYKVDVQIFGTRSTSQGAEGIARTMFQNISVLSVNPQAEPSSQGGFTAPVVTLVVTPADADTLGVADSFGRIRLALRNPVDEGKTTRTAVPVAALYSGSAGVPVRTPAPATAPAPRTLVGLNVELMSVSPDAVDTLKRYGVNNAPGVLGASAVNQTADLDKVLAQLRDQKSIDVLSLSRVTAAVSRTAAVELKAPETGAVRVQFSPFIANGQMKLKIHPEMTVNGGAAPGTRGLETEVDLAAGRSFVISGLRDANGQPQPAGRQLLVLVKPNL